MKKKIQKRSIAEKGWRLFFLLAVILTLSFSPGVSMAKEPYVIGYVADITGMARANYAPEAEGCRLYIDSLNARGGINGHPVKLIIEDGKSQPAASAAVAKKLIVEDEVIAILGLGFTSSQPPVIKLAAENRVAVVAGFSLAVAVNQIKSGTPEEFCFNTGRIMNPKYLPAAYAYAFVANKLHPNGTYAASGYDTPGGRFWSKKGADYSAQKGLKVVYHEDIPPGTMDVSLWANKVARANPDFYALDVGGEIFVTMASALEKAGWEKDQLYPDFVSEADIEKGVKRLMGDGKGILLLSRYASAYDDLPEYQKIKKAMKKFGHQHPLSAHHAQGWTIGRIVEAALQKAGWPCSREQFVDALETLDLDPMGLTGGRIKYTPDNHVGPMFWKLYRWDASKKSLVQVMDWFKVDAKDMSSM
jgi:ABC-type branched-subunit amino acid transport system substrate-binding protein